MLKVYFKAIWLLPRRPLLPVHQPVSSTSSTRGDVRNATLFPSHLYLVSWTILDLAMKRGPTCYPKSPNGEDFTRDTHWHQCHKSHLDIGLAKLGIRIRICAID